MDPGKMANERLAARGYLLKPFEGKPEALHAVLAENARNRVSASMLFEIATSLGVPAAS
jgi:hypothetical protein